MTEAQDVYLKTCTQCGSIFEHPKQKKGKHFTRCERCRTYSTGRKRTTRQPLPHDCTPRPPANPRYRYQQKLPPPKKGLTPTSLTTKNGRDRFLEVAGESDLGEDAWPVYFALQTLLDMAYQPNQIHEALDALTKHKEKKQ